MNAVKLFAPAGYWMLTPEQKEYLTNGCGTRGFGGIIVPDKFYGLRVTEACNIHDYMYQIGETDQDKIDADDVFLNNMLRIIRAAGGPKLIYWLRRRRALIYYQAVHLCGGPAFWNSKNPDAEYKEVEI